MSVEGSGMATNRCAFSYKYTYTKPEIVAIAWDIDTQTDEDGEWLIATADREYWFKRIEDDLYKLDFTFSTFFLAKK